MRPPAYGLAWQLWRRHRLGFSVILAYLAVEIIAAQTIPLSLWSKESAAASAAIPLTMIAMYLMAVFVNAEADFASTTSGYPSYLLVLPVRTRDLAFWPMLYGGIAAVLVWLGAGLLIFLPRGIHIPVWWPAAMLVSMLSGLQAIIWSPISLPYLRAILALILLPAYVFLGVGASQSGVSEAVLVAVYIALLPLSFSIALTGVSRARQGHGGESSWIPERTREKTNGESRIATPFASSMRAQFWMEWKRNGVMFPLFVGVACALFSIPLLFIRETAPLRLVPPGAGQIEANASINILTACLGLPLWLGMVLGAGGRKTDTRRQDLTIHPFIATRPMTSLSLVLAKFGTAALSALAVWMILLAFVCLWLLSPAKEGSAEAPLGYFLLRHLTLKQAFMVFIVIAGVIALTWKCQVESLYIDLAGHRWLTQGYPLIFGIGSTLLMFFGAAFYTNPQLFQKMLNWLPAMAFTLAGVKLIARGTAMAVLIRNRIISSRVAVLLGTGWILLYLSLFALIYALVPVDLAPTKYIALGIFLALPFTRLCLAPLALDWNRHR